MPIMNSLAVLITLGLFMPTAVPFSVKFIPFQQISTGFITVLQNCSLSLLFASTVADVYFHLPRDCARVCLSLIR